MKRFFQILAAMLVTVSMTGCASPRHIRISEAPKGAIPFNDEQCRTIAKEYLQTHEPQFDPSRLISTSVYRERIESTNYEATNFCLVVFRSMKADTPFAAEEWIIMISTNGEPVRSWNVPTKLWNEIKTPANNFADPALSVPPRKPGDPEK